MTVTTPRPAPSRRSGVDPWRVVLTIVVVCFTVFWVWALFFASKESINKIGDRAWAERAEAICVEADTRREALADLRVVDEDTPSIVAERGDLFDRATDIVEQMLDDVVAVAPTDPKGADLVPQWEADYRTYLQDRRQFAELLRTGVNEPFSETAVDGIPISEKLAVFAADNEMPTCSPPIDTSN